MIWLVGNKGMLGQEVSILLDKLNLSFLASDREVDITNPASIDSFTAENNGIKNKIDWIINCSAYTAVDRAEEEKEIAYLINETGVRNLAVKAKELGASIIHISTDYVFDGNSRIPLKEDDPTGPVSVYGASKLAGEKALLWNNPASFIIRTAWLYGEYGNNFVHTMIKLMNSKDSIKVVNDQVGTPTWANDLARLIVHIVKNKSQDYGIYHFTGEGKTNWYEFAKEIYHQGRIKGIITSDCVINPCSSAEYPTAAVRPAFSLLSKEKVKQVFSWDICDWKKSLAVFFDKKEMVL